jgi:hypothetical protein
MRHCAIALHQLPAQQQLLARMICSSVGVVWLVALRRHLINLHRAVMTVQASAARSLSGSGCLDSSTCTVNDSVCCYTAASLAAAVDNLLPAWQQCCHVSAC